MAKPAYKQILISAREILAKPEHWCKRAEARDKYDDHISPLNPLATKWCMLGACRKAAVEVGKDPYGYDLALAISCVADIGGLPIETINDRALPSHADLIYLLDRAIGK